MSVLESYSETEYLLSNGKGGSCSSTVTGQNTRRYHSVLSVSLNPPVNRRILVSRLTEKIINENEYYTFSTLKTANGFKEKGYEYIISFENKTNPVWFFKMGNFLIKKEIFFIHNKNMTIIKYSNISDSPVKLEITPFLNDRDIHSNTLPGQLKIKTEKLTDNSAKFETNFMNNIFVYTNGSISENDYTIHNIFYDVEKERGLFAYEEIVSKFFITASLQPNENLYISFSCEEVSNHFESHIRNEMKYINSLYRKEDSEIIKKLKITSDHFLSYRKSTGNYTILAGYPWFTDWGRDTMIAFEGILLSSSRYTEAKEVLETFMKNIKNGLIPNVFDDYSGLPGGYNTADATLWLFYTLYKYYLYTDDIEYIKDNYEKLTDILTCHINGTDYNIHMTEDYLLWTGDENTQLTWMDVKVENWTVTPRYGKAVEINCLWYNAFKIMEFFSEKTGKNFIYIDYPEKIKESFNNLFWNSEDECLYDYVNNKEFNSMIRPNQIFAVSLPFEIIDGEKQEKVFNCVFKKLYTPFGLKTLSPDDPRYIGIYTGDRWTRDGSYHQGNIWPWLFGHFFDAMYKLNKNDESIKDKIKILLNPMEKMIMNYWDGNIPEILEGNWPYNSKGCFSQAWSVSEILRILIMAE